MTFLTLDGNPQDFHKIFWNMFYSIPIIVEVMFLRTNIWLYPQDLVHSVFDQENINCQTDITC